MFQKRARQVTTFQTKDKKVFIKGNLVEDRGSLASVSTISHRATLLGGFTGEAEHCLIIRANLKATDESGNDVTPKLLNTTNLSAQFRRLRYKIQRHELLRRHSSLQREVQRLSLSRIGGIRPSIDEIIGSIGTDAIQFDDHLFDVEPSMLSMSMESEICSVTGHLDRGPVPPYCRILLVQTEDILLYEQLSSTSQRNTEDGDRAEEDNKAYDYITVGKGKLRRCSDAETQTDSILYKSRDVNTEIVTKSNTGAYVSNFEMYDTLQALKKVPVIAETISSPDEDLEDGDDEEGEHVVVNTAERLDAIGQLPSFKLANMIIRRFIAGNNYEESQRRFRDMQLPSPLAPKYNIRYSMNLLFRFQAQVQHAERKAVTDLSWCSKNGDILAAGYGIYSFSAMHVPNSGYVCVWNIKNPDDPERCYYFNCPVVCVCFAPMMGTLLAVGLYDGSIEIFDITKPNQPAIAVSLRSSSPSCEPVMEIRWLGSHVDEYNEIEPLLAVTQNSTITKHHIINSPYLLSFQQMALERAEDKKSGLILNKDEKVDVQANRQPQGRGLTLHPTQSDVYYVLTDEGYMHKCSTNYPHQHLEVGQAHDASVNNMDFSPWSPMVFLTSGNDWTTRIWVDGVFKPIITLRNPGSMPVHCSFWSRTHSTVIISVNRKFLNIWDLRRSTLNPVACTSIDSSFHTMCKFSTSGTTLALGNERGNILVCSFDDFPFPPHMQYDELVSAIYKAMALDKVLLNEVKLIGIRSYPGKGKHIRT